MTDMHDNKADFPRRASRTALSLLAGALIALLVSPIATAQQSNATPPATASGSGSSSAFRFNGEIGTQGELYSVSGIERRRPSSSARLFLRSTLTAWQSISASFNVILSTEGNSARQDINQLDFNPRWRWGSAHVGDFTEELSPLTLSGVKIRGGGLMLTPSRWRIALMSGLTNRAVSSETSSRSYERTITGVSLGYGKSDGSSIALIVVNARDRLSSLASLPVDTTAPDTSLIDTTQASFEQDPITVTPQENLVVSIASRLNILNRKLRWQNEVGGSAITRDRRSAELNNSGVPGFLTNLFTPRKSSGADFAYMTDLSLDLHRLSVTAGFHYLGPGYVSLGVASLMSDKQEITSGITYRFKRGLVRVDAALQNDNLIHQKSYTTDRTRINTLVSYRITPIWNMTAGVTALSMSNNARSDTTRLDYSNWIVRTNHQIMLRRPIGLKNLSCDLIYQNAADDNPLRAASGNSCLSASVGAGIGINSSLDLVPAVGLISSKSGNGGRTLTQNYVLSARHTALERRLSSSLSMAVTVAPVTTTLRPNLRSSYDLGHNFTVATEIEATSLKGGPVASRFNEIACRLSLSRRF